VDIQKIRYGLYIAIAVVALLLWGKWNAVNTPETPKVTVQQQKTSAITQQTVPASIPNAHHSTTHTAVPTTPTTKKQRLIHVKTDVLSLTINPIGGTIVKADLLKYPQTLHNKTPIALLNHTSSDYYVASMGFEADSLKAPLVFTSQQQQYEIGNQRQLVVTLKAKQHSLTIVRRYTLLANSYQIQVSQEITNQSDQAVKGRFYAQLTRTPPGKHSSLLHSYTTYTGAAVSTQNDHYQKISFSDMSSSQINLHSQGGWVAMLQHYFISAWVPPAKQQNQFYSQASGNQYTIAMAYPKVTIAAGKSINQSASLYIGPAIAKNLEHVAPYLDKTIDYGWLWFISVWIFALMSWIFQYVGNWGWAIVLTTLVIKLVFYPLSSKSYRSMAKMRELGPRIKQLKERLGDDRQALSKATMELYRKEKVNPLGGCLPMVIQIPVFIGLYWVLMESVELRQAPFLLWIHDLSQQDPYYILPILMGASMFLQQRLNPAPADPMQAKVMMFLPVFFTVIFLSFPAGLVLYWLVNNLVSILQQWWVMRRYMQVSRQKKRTAR
jgi:YidC/Oxa1 family membrane protein insertase